MTETLGRGALGTSTLARETDDAEDGGARVGDVGERVPCVREVLDDHEDCGDGR